MFFVGGSPGFGALQLGGGVSNGVNIFMQQTSQVFDFSNGGQGFSSVMTIAAPAIPEPETYAMLLAGLGFLGFAARRRKQKKTAAD